MHHRFHLPQPLTAGETVTLQGDEAHHAVRVVRVREREEVEVFDGKGAAARGIVETLGRDEVRIRLTAALPTRESSFELTLAMAIINLDKFELVLQKATELGARRIIPIESERVELRRERYAGKMERWNRVVFEAVKQCGRAMIPALDEPQSFEDAIARDGVKLLFDADADPDPILERPAAATLFIGPEGGWSEDELTLARSFGSRIERLGPRRLRAETAAIVATAIVSARWGDI